MKLQSAIEYLMTYGWAFMIMASVLIALALFGVFNGGSNLQQSCVFPGTFGCSNLQINTNGIIRIQLQLLTNYPVNIVSIGCNSNQTTSNMLTYATPVNMLVGATNTFSVQCYTGITPYNSIPGTAFRGSLVINYTDSYTGIRMTTFGTLIVTPS
jgi:hypothetical membrane protein